VRHDEPAYVPLADLAPGQLADFFALLIEKSPGTTRDGKPYFTCRFRDRVRTASAMVWADSAWFVPCASQWQEGRFFKIRAVYGEHGRFGPQLEIHQIREVDAADRDNGFDPADFVEHSRFDREAMFDELLQLAREQIVNGPLRELVVTLLNRHEGAVKMLPATPRHFYPFVGGLLEHILSVTHTCLDLADHYVDRFRDVRPPLNRDLVVAGAILHDIGRVAELETASVAAEPTVPGRLFGHLFLGRDLVHDTAAQIDGLDPELVRLLEHIVITHLNLPAWGSPRLPLIPECLIVHHADDLDAKLEMYARCLITDQEPGDFTARDPILGRRLYKGRQV
jgi:3'-5' exoribonuclease